jgi:sugar (pentulose or hexulose) kinase
MRENQTVCAIDVGSTLIKATLRAGVDQVLARVSVPYPRDVGLGSSGVHDAVWTAFAAAVREVCANRAPDAVILSCQMAGLSMVDGSGRPFGPLIPGVEMRNPNAGMIDIRGSGCGDVRVSGVSKLLWLAETATDLDIQSMRIGGIKEFLLYRLAGEWVTDPASASSSGFYDLAAQGWSAETLGMTNVDEWQLPRIAEMDAVIGAVLPTAAAECGIPADVAVYCGLGDGPAANISSGAVRPDVMCFSRGTTVVARVLFSGSLPELGSFPIFIQHVQKSWKCVGVRLTVDPASGLFEPPGDSATMLRPEEVGDYLQPLLDAFTISDVRPVGGREIPFPANWPVHQVPADAQDGTRGMALVASGWKLESGDHSPAVTKLVSNQGAR